MDDNFVADGVINLPEDEGGGFVGYSGDYKDGPPYGLYFFILVFVILCMFLGGAAIRCSGGACREPAGGWPTATQVSMIINYLGVLA